MWQSGSLGGAYRPGTWAELDAEVTPGSLGGFLQLARKEEGQAGSLPSASGCAELGDLRGKGRVVIFRDVKLTSRVFGVSASCTTGREALLL